LTPLLSRLPELPGETGCFLGWHSHGPSGFEAFLGFPFISFFFVSRQKYHRTLRGERYAAICAQTSPRIPYGESFGFFCTHLTTSRSLKNWGSYLVRW